MEEIRNTMVSDEKKKYEELLTYVFENIDKEQYNEYAYEIASKLLGEEICFEVQNIVLAVLNTHVEYILEVGAEYGSFTGKLSEWCDNLETFEKDADKITINKIRQKDKKNITFVNDIDYSKKYDVIFMNFADSGMSKYGFSSVADIYGKLKNILSDTGRIIIILANEYGKYDSDDKYNKDIILKKLDEAGVVNANIYYPYPGIRKNMLYMFSDERLPFISEMFFNKTTCKEGDFDELIKNCAFADCFIVEISEIADKKHIEYSKLSVMRKEELRIRTDIVKDKAGIRSIIKNSVDDSCNHIQKMKISYEELSKLFGGTLISVNKIISSNESAIEFEFIEGDVLFDIIAEEFNVNEKGACEYIYRYAQLLRAKAMEKFKFTEEFYNVFGRELTEDNFYSFKYTDVDMCFDNLIIRNGKWELIDYEFCFDFPIPVDYVIYRSIFYFFNKLGNGNKHGKYKNIILQKLNIFNYVQKFHKMEIAFQKYVNGNVRYQRYVLEQCTEKNTSISDALNNIKN